MARHFALEEWRKLALLIGSNSSVNLLMTVFLQVCDLNIAGYLGFKVYTVMGRIAKLLTHL
jgi:hypothetical protein